MCPLKIFPWKNLCKNTAVDSDMMVGKITGEVLGPEVDYTCFKGNQVNFIV